LMRAVHGEGAGRLQHRQRERAGSDSPASTQGLHKGRDEFFITGHLILLSVQS
jgi:hypothetical protein